MTERDQGDGQGSNNPQRASFPTLGLGVNSSPHRRNTPLPLDCSFALRFEYKEVYLPVTLKCARNTTRVENMKMNKCETEMV